ncbi:MAG TPA: FG-GAP-like repeat-containing protein [Pyrinomonadaceae bacterium]|nr:FG-GAP-like repeat-containing protein [Pyrinomonadaceae bacterium]
MKIKRASAVTRLLPLLLTLLLLFTSSSRALPQVNQTKVRTTGRATNGKLRDVSAAAREAAYRANNLGVALLEQFKHREGAAEFQRALTLDPRLALARINLSIALFNVPDFDAASGAARSALEVAPRAPQPHYILGLIAKQQNRADDAVSEFRRVLEIDSRDVGALVQLGQLYAQQRKYTEAVAAFRTAVEAEPYNGTALYNLATALLRGGEREEGQRLINRFQALRESGAATIIGQNYLEQGRYAEAVTSTGAEPGLVDKTIPRVAFVDATASVMPQDMGASGGRLVSRSGLDNRRANNRRANNSLPRRRITRAPSENAPGEILAAAHGGSITLFDYDDDGDLDLLELDGAKQRLYRNDAGKFFDITNRSGALGAAADGTGTAALAGDYDNDGREDLFVLRYGRSTLYHNDGGGKFSDRTTEAKLPAYPYLSISTAFADVDHDGDLDIFVAGFADLRNLKTTPPPANKESPGSGGVRGEANQARDSVAETLPGAPNMLLRNNGDGTFKDITAASKVSGAGGHAVAVIPTDYDNLRDVDLLVVNQGAPPVLYRNLRDTTFQDIAGQVGLGAGGDFTSAAAGDVNKDGFTDFYFGAGEAPGTFALSDGRGRFRLEAAPPSRGRGDGAQRGVRDAAQFLDYDNDGLLDLVRLSAGGAQSALRVLRNVGDDWADVTRAASSSGRNPFAAASPWTGAARVLASGDVDGDGDTDLFARGPSGVVRFLRNEGGSRNRSMRVRLTGKVSNRGGVGSKIEARAGSLKQRIETYSASPSPAPADVLFGIGARDAADAVRVLWPSGVVQAETEALRGEGAQAITRVRATRVLGVTELDRKPSSCPYLYTWNGSRFEFVTDFMGGGEIGYWEAPGVRAAPDPDEFVRIRGDQLRARDGRYEIRVTNELEEGLFVDRLQLLAVAHPAGVEVYPNEGLGNPTSSAFKLYATHEARPPRAAADEHGHDVLDALSQMDRKYPDDFQLLGVRGYAKEHTLTLDLGRGDGRAREPSTKRDDGRERTLLLLTGWTDYAFSSDNVSAAQMGLSLSPPALQVKDRAGKWQTVIADIGIPVGRPQTVVVDMTGKFLSASREVRVITNMRIYWDQILVDTSPGEFPTTIERLDPLVANLKWRGFSAETTPDGREPFGYDYARVSHASPWKTFPGRYTREGDVRELLLTTDDMFVVSRPGDELSVSFDARTLSPLPDGWTRTFLLYADGFSKEMDINSASPHQLAPLPFHGMKSYPYNAPDAYPSTPAHRAYVERYNTRLVAAPVPELVNGKW